MLISIDVHSADPLTGVVVLEDVEPVRFEGWLALLRALSEMLGDRTDPPAR